jgi:acetylornithine deacetylase/succinyl-diaminopimelate desuccinylase-like protein
MPADPMQIAELWAEEALPSIEGYIRIPNQSPGFDPEWATNGLLDQAVEHVAAWCREHGPDGLLVEVVRLPERTPVILMELPARGTVTGTALLYGHVDKQPPMLPWDQGLDPYEPVVRHGRMYGRGAADDGYSAYASVIALRALEDARVDHGRCVVLIEASEESGSPDLEPYLDHLAERIGTPELVVCLDSGCGNYDQLWVTTSLRGLVGGVLTVEVLTEGVHSGDGGGIVPDSFRIIRMLLDRVEVATTGEVTIAEANVEIPADRAAQAAVAASELGDPLIERFPWVDGDAPDVDLTEAVLARTWRPALGVHGADGLPAVAQAGNVLRPATSLRLSIRIPPTADARAVVGELESRLTGDEPEGTVVSFAPDFVGQGWNSPALALWLASALEEASQQHFDKPVCFMGEGGSIPFMAMLGERFPAAQFFITGVLGPNSNAHGPNEFLHMDFTRRLICCVADVLEAHAAPRPA